MNVSRTPLLVFVLISLCSVMLLAGLPADPVAANSDSPAVMDDSMGILQAYQKVQAAPPASGTSSTQVPPTQVGSALYLTSTPALDGSISHTVQSGEFLITIAQQYGVSLDELLVLNNLTADSILQIGQVLLIKRGETPLPALTSGTVIAATATIRPSLTPKPTLTPYLTATPTATEVPGPGVFTRVFTGNAKYLGLGVLALIVLGIVLLLVSSKRIH
ncbi:MAG: LysM peptidoglycan-binding domain-containing protein [Anaerolineaceae bacterium]